MILICHLSIPSTEGISSKPQGGMAEAPPSLEEAIRDFHRRFGFWQTNEYQPLKRPKLSHESLDLDWCLDNFLIQEDYN